MTVKHTLKEAAEEYEPQTTKNISELDRVSTDLYLYYKTFKKEDGKEFTINLIEVDGEEYRVPNSVLKQVKVLLGETPKLKYFKVLKQGEGLKTTYMVVSLDTQEEKI